MIIFFIWLLGCILFFIIGVFILDDDEIVKDRETAKDIVLKDIFMSVIWPTTGTFVILLTITDFIFPIIENAISNLGNFILDKIIYICVNKNKKC